MEAPSRPPARRTLTPAVLLAAAFTVVCAIGSIAFVAANGGLQAPRFAAASITPTQPRPSPEPATAGLRSAAPSPGSGSSPDATTAPPSGTPPAPSIAPTPNGSADPLSALPACPGHPGCYLYTIRRGDTLSTISDRWLISISIIEVLNPQVTDPSTIAIGQPLYLGRTPFVRLDRCPDMPACYLYIVRAGDRLSTIAGRFGTTTNAILALNPKVTDPNAIYSGQTIRLPGP